MAAKLIIEKEEMLSGFKVISKKPDLSENEYKMKEYQIVSDILNKLSGISI